ncbi:tyrosine-type recombinase/integrase [Limosilactobacillus sp.]|uniref:tyrosine-type recombinase/integrase n=1 Tax=Limosilactobacillus sp. TaxID=2773925 RepID=UPI003F108B9D
METAVTDYLAYLARDQGRSANTVASYRRDLKRARAFFKQQGVDDWEAVDQYMVLNLVASQRQAGRSTATINRLLSVLRQFYHYLIRHHQVQVNPMELVDNEQPSARKQPVILTEEEVHRLLTTPAAGDRLANRDYALMSLMAATGMRVSEVVNLQLADLHLDIKMVRLGNGSKRERLVPVSTAAVAALNHYLTAVRPQLAANGEQAVFVNAHGHSLSRQGIWKNLKGRVTAAGITKAVTPQTLRYSFAVHLLRNGADSRLLQEMLGYSEMRMLQPYLKMSVKELSLNYQQHQPWK